MARPILAYLLLGQSNMFGTSPTVEPGDPDLLVLDPRSLNREIVTGGVTVPATDAYGTFRQAPGLIHEYLYATPPVPSLGGPGVHFGLRMRALYPHRRFALLATARASEVATLLSDENNDYSDTIDTAIKAQQLGATICGVLTHHGERDTGFGALTPENLLKAQTFHERYEQVITNIRADLGLPDLPAVHAQLGLVDHARIPGIPVVTESPFRSLWEEVQDSQELVDLPHTAMIETMDFWDLPGSDGLHNTSAGNVIEGRRFADEIVALGHPLLTGRPRLWWRK